MKFNNHIGIVSYGVYIPKKRIKTIDIAKQWGKSGDDILKGLGIVEKSVPNNDEDSITMAVYSSSEALKKVKIKEGIEAIYMGSESHPYAVKSSSAIIGEALGIGNKYTAADLEFACKAGTAALQISLGLVSSKAVKYALAIGSDTAQSRPNDALEYSAAASSASFLIGRDDVIAEVLYSSSYTSDTPDFWRREHQQYPMHAGRFTGGPSYFKHILSAVKQVLEESKMSIKDFKHVVFHMPNASFPKKVAEMLGVSKKQLEAGFTVPYLGNTYSACSLTGLASVLDKAKNNELILLCSYGSGSGSDAFILKVTNSIKKIEKTNTVESLLNDKEYINYGEYLKLMRTIKMN